MPTATASPSSEPSRASGSPTSRTPSNSGPAWAVRMVTWRAGPPMFSRVMTRAILGGRELVKRPPEAFQELDFRVVSDRRLGERDISQRVQDVAFARWRKDGGQRSLVQSRDALGELQHCVRLTARDVHR